MEKICRLDNTVPAYLRDLSIVFIDCHRDLAIDAFRSLSFELQ